jgi:hypothetical protein
VWLLMLSLENEGEGPKGYQGEVRLQNKIKEVSRVSMF